ncbi:MAG TPA: dTDP-4-dehydrorhamnose reductase [Vicinamibacteria bacterium]
MKALVVGAGGQLGQALAARLGGSAPAFSREALDIRDGEAVGRAVLDAAPEVVFNASAYNKVDGAESEPAEAFAVNALGPLFLARACAAAGALLVHVSTDYVFDGSGARPWREEDLPAPLGVYGASKLAGEHLVAAAAPAHLIVRTSAVLGVGASRAKGGSFVERILSRARAGQPLRVVADQTLAPTYAPDLAEALLALAASGARGLWHVTGEGACTWHQLAVAALSLAGLAAPVAPISSAELNAPARRPAYSVLDTSRYRARALPRLRSWREALPSLLPSS